jgi:excisionase family DNA binding protein
MTTSESSQIAPSRPASGAQSDDPAHRLAAGQRLVDQRLHTPAEAAALLTVRESWLRRQAGQRRIPCTFLGRHLRFSDRDLDAIVAAGSRAADAPLRRRTRRRHG